ncbi:cation diffusion facilitator family transporter [Syntrophus aciditrophicus]|nr:cation diffusion facilitator family transporter [Syntrophus aciditrophicus]
MTGHHPQHISWGNRLLMTMMLNLVIPVVQIIGGILAGSMALISDALHNLSDFTSLLISYVALRMGERQPTVSQTFGYKRIEVLAALVNVSLLYGVAIFIAIEGWQRLLAPQVIKGQLVVWIALAGLAGNAFSAVLLHAGAKTNINIRSSFLHMLTDALTSLGVVVLGIIWLYRPWYRLDTLVSWGIVALIFYGGWGILKETYQILMNATPPGISVKEIKRAVEAIEGIREIHHIHVWTLSPDRAALAAHIIVDDQMLSQVDLLVSRVRELLWSRFGIDHPTLQFETRSEDNTFLLCCPKEHNHHH